MFHIIILGHADLIKKETLSFIKKLSKYKNSSMVFRQNGYQWLSNKKRFLDKIDMMDASFVPQNLDRSIYLPNI